LFSISFDNTIPALRLQFFFLSAFSVYGLNNRQHVYSDQENLKAPMQGDSGGMGFASDEGGGSGNVDDPRD